jgi:translocator assembly and maintenance protein 41
MTDFLISTPEPVEFHKDNLRLNPSHYPFWARMAGPKTIASVQDEYGAGVWYVTMVNMRGLVS